MRLYGFVLELGVDIFFVIWKVGMFLSLACERKVEDSVKEEVDKSTKIDYYHSLSIDTLGFREISHNFSHQD